jgi:hypothetical protein
LPLEARRGEGTALMGCVGRRPQQQSCRSRLRCSRAASSSGGASSSAASASADNTLCTPPLPPSSPLGSSCQFCHRSRVLRRQHWRPPPPVGLGGGASSCRAGRKSKFSSQSDTRRRPPMLARDGARLLHDLRPSLRLASY